MATPEQIRPEEIGPDWATKNPPTKAFQIVHSAIEDPEVAQKVEQLEEERILSMTHGKVRPPEFKVLKKPEESKPWWKALEDRQYGDKDEK